MLLQIFTRAIECKVHSVYIGTRNCEMTILINTPIKGRSRGVSKVSRNWSDHLWLVFACISLIMSMLPSSYTFMRWKPVIKVSRSALAYACISFVSACVRCLQSVNVWQINLQLTFICFVHNVYPLVMCTHTPLQQSIATHLSNTVEPVAATSINQPASLAQISLNHYKLPL